MNDGRILKTERTFPYAPAAIYTAFASAPVLASWWGPDGFTNAFETFAFEPDGRWVFTMHGPDGRQYPNSCVFGELEPDRRIVIRHDCAPLFTLTVTLASTDGGTQLVWEQAFDDADTAQALRPICEPANEQNLDRLMQALTRMRLLS